MGKVLPRILPVLIVVFVITLPSGILCWLTLYFIGTERERIVEDLKRSYGEVLREVLSEAQKWYVAVLDGFGEDELENYKKVRKTSGFVEASIVTVGGKIVFPTSGLPYGEYPGILGGYDYGALYSLYEAERRRDVQGLKNVLGTGDRHKREVAKFALARLDSGFRNQLSGEVERLEGVVDAEAAALYLKARYLSESGNKEAAAVISASLVNRLIQSTDKLTYSEIRYYVLFVRGLLEESRQVLGRILVQEIESALERLDLMERWAEKMSIVKGERKVEKGIVEVEKGNKQYWLFYNRDSYLREHIWRVLSGSFGGPVVVAMYDGEGKKILGEEGVVLIARERLSAPFEGYEVSLYYRSAEIVREETALRTRAFAIVSVLGLAAVVCGATLLYLALLKKVEETRRKSDFVSNISHELKTPLTAIRVYTETLAAGRYKDDKEKQHFLGIVTQQTEKLEVMIDRLLQFSRMERGIISYNFTSVWLSDFVDSVVYEFNLQNRGEDVRLHLAVPDTAIEMKVDSDALKEALLNILNNAVKYTLNRPKDVFFRVFTPPGKVVFEVEDRGIGIPRWAQKKVFERFFRLENGERKVGGAGIGLSIAKLVVEAHKGKIELQSEEGKGSIFRVVLPVRQ